MLSSISMSAMSLRAVEGIGRTREPPVVHFELDGVKGPPMFAQRQHNSGGAHIRESNPAAAFRIIGIGKCGLVAFGCAVGGQPIHSALEQRRVPFGHQREVATPRFRARQACHASQLAWNRHAGAGQKGAGDFSDRGLSIHAVREIARSFLAGAGMTIPGELGSREHSFCA